MDKERFDYLTSERFIHDDLLRSAQNTLDEACRIWEESEKKLVSYAIAWPAEAVRATNGKDISGPIIMMMPERGLWTTALNGLVEKTKAYGLFLIDVSDLAIVAKFETSHGARAWTIPIQWHGDRRMLGSRKVKDNAECVGLLWSPNRGQA